MYFISFYYLLYSFNASFSLTLALLHNFSAPTGAYPEQTTVYAQVSQLFVALSWYIYSANSDTDIKTYYREQLLTEDVMSNNNMKYSAHKDDTNRCLPSESSESTTFFNLFVLHPTLASAGEYTLVQDVYSVTITLGRQIL